MATKVKTHVARLLATTGIMLCLFSSSAMAEQASYAGTDTCLECHEDMATELSASLHGKALIAGCEACHGPGSAHVASPSRQSIISFGRGAAQDAKTQSQQCLECHAASQEVALWDMGKHASRDVACSSCHSIHDGYSPLPSMPETCYGCHLNVKEDANKQSRHPIKEGEMSCGDCHNPHGTTAEAMLRDETINQLCYQCHADKRGPFMWEHPPVAENCATCHSPHGSRHKKMLVQKTPNLCQSCHDWSLHVGTAYGQANSFAGTSPSNRFFGKSCQNCHINIHGSRAPNNVGGSAGGSSRSNGKFFLR